MPGRVAAVVVRYRGGDEVERCLRSLLDLGGPDLGTVCLVDSGSGDGGAEHLGRHFPAVEVHALEHNRGFAAAANHGVEATREELILLLNPDTVVHPAAVAALVHGLRERPEAAGTVPLLHGLDGTCQHRWQLRRLPTAGRLALGLAGAPAHRRPPSAPTPVAQPAAAAWLVRRAVWAELGGLDPGYAPAWWEDVDFCARLARLRGPGAPGTAGFWVVPEATVSHRGGASLDHLERGEFLTMFHRNLQRYARRHHPAAAPLICALHRLSLHLRAGLRPTRRRAWRQATRALASRPRSGHH